MSHNDKPSDREALKKYYIKEAEKNNLKIDDVIKTNKIIINTSSVDPTTWRLVVELLTEIRDTTSDKTIYDKCVRIIGPKK